MHIQSLSCSQHLTYALWCRLAQQHATDLASWQQAKEQLLADKEAAVKGAEQQAAEALQMLRRQHALALLVRCLASFNKSEPVTISLGSNEPEVAS